MTQQQYEIEILGDGLVAFLNNVRFEDASQNLVISHSLLRVLDFPPAGDPAELLHWTTQSLPAPVLSIHDCRR